MKKSRDLRQLATRQLVRFLAYRLSRLDVAFNFLLRLSHYLVDRLDERESLRPLAAVLRT